MILEPRSHVMWCLNVQSLHIKQYQKGGERQKIHWWMSLIMHEEDFLLVAIPDIKIIYKELRQTLITIGSIWHSSHFLIWLRWVYHCIVTEQKCSCVCICAALQASVCYNIIWYPCMLSIYVCTCLFDYSGASPWHGPGPGPSPERRPPRPSLRSSAPGPPPLGSAGSGGRCDPASSCGLRPVPSAPRTACPPGPVAWWCPRCRRA